MPRVPWRKRTRTRREPLSPALREYLETGEFPTDATLAEDSFRRDEAALRGLWRAHRDEVLSSFSAEHPGRRPWAWWRFDAPDTSRTRLGGTGTPCHEVLAYAPAYAFGIPVHWIEPWMVAYYNGRARDVHGNRIGTQYIDGQFKGLALDPSDPPRYESEATYLRRHELLTGDERVRPTAADYEPEVLEKGRGDADE